MPPAAHVLAAKTDRWTEILFRALSARAAKRWRFVSFRGRGGKEWRGVVDVIGIRKNTDAPKHASLRRGDLFDVVLIQLKGGSAPAPSTTDCLRLRAVKRYYRAREVVLFSWRRGERCTFQRLERNGHWSDPVPAVELFGR